MPKIFITRKIPAIGIKLLKEKGYEVAVGPEEKISRKDLLSGIKGADAILSVLTENIDAETLAMAGPQLKIVANFAVGYNNIDVKTAKEKGIAVTNTPGVLTDAVADHAVGLLFAAAQRIVAADKYTRDGKFTAWGPELFLGADIFGRVLGIVGLGRIGAAVAERMNKGFGMKIIYYDLKRNEEAEEKFGWQYRELDELMKEADFISVHTNLSEQTKHLISRERLEMMKPSACLINTSRGPIVDEQALVVVLKEKKIMAAGLDVFENEPSLSPGLAELDNVALTPHIASATKDTRDKMAEIAAQNIIAVLEGGAPINPVE